MKTDRSNHNWGNKGHKIIITCGTFILWHRKSSRAPQAYDNEGLCVEGDDGGGGGGGISIPSPLSPLVLSYHLFPDYLNLWYRFPMREGGGGGGTGQAETAISSAYLSIRALKKSTFTVPKRKKNALKMAHGSEQQYCTDVTGCLRPCRNHDDAKITPGNSTLDAPGNLPSLRQTLT